MSLTTSSLFLPAAGLSDAYVLLRMVRGALTFVCDAAVLTVDKFEGAKRPYDGSCGQPEMTQR